MTCKKQPPTPHQQPTEHTLFLFWGSIYAWPLFSERLQPCQVRRSFHFFICFSLLLTFTKTNMFTSECAPAKFDLSLLAGKEGKLCCHGLKIPVAQTHMQPLKAAGCGARATFLHRLYSKANSGQSVSEPGPFHSLSKTHHTHTHTHGESAA